MAFINGQAAAHVLGQPNFTSNTGAISQTGVNGAQSTAYDPVRHWLFVADSLNFRVLVFDLSLGVVDGMPAIHVLGQPDFTTSVSNRTEKDMSAPSALAYDPTHQLLFVGDS